MKNIMIKADSIAVAFLALLGIKLEEESTNDWIAVIESVWLLLNISVKFGCYF